MPELIAYCGIDCDQCPALIAHRTGDRALQAKTAQEWSKAFGHDFKPEDVDCVGCTVESGPHIGYCAMCEIRKCARERKLDNCAACAEFSCTRLTEFHKQVPKAMESLDRVRAKRK
jgi:hypothetical protein